MCAQRMRHRSHEQIRHGDVRARPLSRALLPAQQPAGLDLPLQCEMRRRRPARERALGHGAPGAGSRATPLRRPRARPSAEPERGQPRRCPRARRAHRPPVPGGRGETRAPPGRCPPRAPSGARPATPPGGPPRGSAARGGASPGARIRAITLPTVTSSPACAVTAASVPSAGASSSTVTLSVSTSISGWFWRTGVTLRAEPAHHAPGVLGHAQGRHDDVGGHVSPACSRDRPAAGVAAAVARVEVRLRLADRRQRAADGVVARRRPRAAPRPGSA